MSDLSSANAADLRRLLSDGLETSHALIELLNREQPLLKSGPAADIDSLLEQKSSLLERLERIQKQIARAGMIRLSGNERLYIEFRDNLEVCKKMNMQSDLIVRYRIDHTRRALDILSGQGSGDPLYFSDGRQPVRRDGRLLMRI